MNTYRVNVDGVAHEVYIVRANSPEEVEEMMQRGDFPAPIVSEVEGAEITTIEEED